MKFFILPSYPVSRRSATAPRGVRCMLANSCVALDQLSSAVAA